MMDLNQPAPKPTPLDIANELAPELPLPDWWTAEPETSLVIPALGIAPGPAHLVTGTWYVGKTIILMHMGLAVATGKRLFGIYEVKRGKWIHFDYEMGRRHFKRYANRFRQGMGFEPEDLEGHASARVLPKLNLRTSQAIDHYTELLRGCTIATIDPLRAAAPGVDENKSEFREYLDMLAVASDRTGCSVVVLHHGGKPATEGMSRRNVGRGTSAIDDAVQSKFVLSSEGKGEPVLVSHEKTRELTHPLDDFYVEFVGDDRELRLVHRDMEEVQSADSMKKIAGDIARLESTCDKVRGYLVMNGKFEGGIGKLGKALKLSKQTTGQVISHLEGQGEVFNEGTERKPIYVYRAGRSS